MKIIKVLQELTRNAYKFEALKNENETLMNLLRDIRHQYLGFKLLSPSTLARFDEIFGDPPHNVVLFLEKQGITKNQFDVIPRKQYEEIRASLQRSLLAQESLLTQLTDKKLKDEP